jgi:hypothetical protein
MASAQNISELVLSDLAMHNSCVLNINSAQNTFISVRFNESTHKHCAFKSVFAQNINVFGHLREIKTICS